jgi:hypothetical protein
VNDDLGVATSAKPVPTANQPLAQGYMIVNFAIEHDPDRVVFVADWLMPGCKIYDAEAAHAQSNIALRERALVIGTTMDNGARHPAQDFGTDLSARLKVQDAHNPTH